MPIPSRAELWSALGRSRFDVLVIGGGITGCGIARDAVLRGLSVALVEKDDFASGTSSRSSRLIHGGIRYLEHGELHLVMEASAERRRLLRLAPHLVRPLSFVWPVYEGARIPRWKLAAGLTAYDGLALFRNVHPHHRLTASDVLAAEPSLRAEGLLGGARYYDAATDDARLTLANAIGALEQGAVPVNHVRVSSLRMHGDRVAGAMVVDEISGQSAAVRARVVINATGPWSDAIRTLEEPQHTQSVQGSIGVHIAVPRTRIANREALTLLAADGRVTFALPAGTMTILGTTETEAPASPDSVHPSAGDVEYLLELGNMFFPNAKLTRGDVVAAWAGIRPLVAGGRSAGDASREHAITISGGGMISITGGKLTTFRIMARDAVNVACKTLGIRGRRSTTRRAVLPGGDFESVAELEASVSAVVGGGALARHLVSSYGTRWTDVWAEVQRDGGSARLDPSLPYMVGEARYAATSECAMTLADILIRRTKLAFEARDHGAAAARITAAAIAPLLGWTARDVDVQLAAFDQRVATDFGIT